MHTIRFELNNQGRGAFFIKEGKERIAEMVIKIDGTNLTVYHTQVSEKFKGEGIASQVLAYMVEYVREHGLKVIALCPYVLAQFKRHPDLYADIWNQHWHR